MSKKRLGLKRRLERCYRRLGTRSPVCVICGEDDPHCLERHHVAGISNHDDAAIICRNCHRKLTAMQQDHPSRELLDTPDDSVRLSHYLHGLSDMFGMLSPRLRRFADSVIKRGEE